MRDSETSDLDALMQDKLEAHCRQQLSAMLDGTLAPDQARFLLRRLQHDHELAGCWERWQVYGDLMRGSVPALLPADFSQRVQAALAGDGQAQAAAAVSGGQRLRWAGWAGGAALAASVAVAALFVNQRAPVQTAPADAAAQLAASAPVESAPSRPAPAPAPAAPEPTTLDAAGAVAATALAAAEAPRRAAARREREPVRRTVASNMRASAAPAQAVARTEVATPAAAPAETPAAPRIESPVGSPLRAVAAANPSQSVPGTGTALPSVQDLFVDEPIVPSRPWPRAILPGLSGDAFTVDYGGNAADDGGFEYFEPQLPAEPPPQ